MATVRSYRRTSEGLRSSSSSNFFLLVVGRFHGSRRAQSRLVADRTQNTENPRFVNLGSPPSCLASSRVMGAPRVKPAPRQSLIEYRTQNTHHSRLGKTRFPADVPCFSRVMGEATPMAVADRTQGIPNIHRGCFVHPVFPNHRCCTLLLLVFVRPHGSSLRHGRR